MDRNDVHTDMKGGTEQTGINVCETCKFSTGEKCDITGYSGPFMDFTAYDYNNNGICRYYRKSVLKSLFKSIKDFLKNIWV